MALNGARRTWAASAAGPILGGWGLAPRRPRWLPRRWDRERSAAVVTSWPGDGRTSKCGEGSETYLRCTPPRTAPARFLRLRREDRWYRKGAGSKPHPLTSGTDRVGRRFVLPSKNPPNLLGGGNNHRPPDRSRASAFSLFSSSQRIRCWSECLNPLSSSGLERTLSNQPDETIHRAPPIHRYG